MDVSAFIAGLRGVPSYQVKDHAPRKMSALRAAFAKLDGSLGYKHFEDFVDSLPPSLLTSIFGSDSLDRYYTELMGGMAAGYPEIDIVAAVVLNFVLGQLTYQGRYLGRSWPEVLVRVTGRMDVAAMGTANCAKVANFSIGETVPIADPVRIGLQTHTLNHAPFDFGAVQQLPQMIMRSPPRMIGCLYFGDLARATYDGAILATAVAGLRDVTSPDAYYLFTGEASLISELALIFGKQNTHASRIERYYSQDIGGASLRKGLLLLNGGSGDLEIPAGLQQSEYVPSVHVGLSDEAALAFGIRKFVTREPERVPLRTPAFVSSSVPLSADHVGKISDELVIHHQWAAIRNGRVIDARDPFYYIYLVAAEDRGIVHDFVETSTFGLSSFGKGGALPAKPEVHVSGEALLFAFTPTILNFHSHFLLQCFPRLMLLRALGRNDIKILVPQTLKRYQRDMMKLVGVDDDQLVIMNPEYDYVCDTLFVPAIIPAIFTPYNVGVYDELISKIKLSDVKPHRRLLISRDMRTSWRNLLNFDTICDVLIRDHGFELVSPEKLSLEDEVKLFQECEIVVGAEGSGLYNCCFMREGTDVVVLADEDYVMYIIGSMAEIRGIDVSFVFGESFLASRDLQRKAGHADFIVDPDRAAACVAAILARRRIGGE